MSQLGDILRSSDMVSTFDITSVISLLIRSSVCDLDGKQKSMSVHAMET